MTGIDGIPLPREGLCSGFAIEGHAADNPYGVVTSLMRRSRSDGAPVIGVVDRLIRRLLWSVNAWDDSAFQPEPQRLPMDGGDHREGHQRIGDEGAGEGGIG